MVEENPDEIATLDGNDIDQPRGPFFAGGGSGMFGVPNVGALSPFLPVYEYPPQGGLGVGCRRWGWTPKYQSQDSAGAALLGTGCMVEPH